jgi:hypothetical protein
VVNSKVRENPYQEKSFQHPRVLEKSLPVNLMPHLPGKKSGKGHMQDIESLK